MFTGVTVMTVLPHASQGRVFSILNTVQIHKNDQSHVLKGMLLRGAEWLNIVFRQQWQVCSEGELSGLFS